jgi:hypothetical protein
MLILLCRCRFNIVPMKKLKLFYLSLKQKLFSRNFCINGYIWKIFANIRQNWQIFANFVSSLSVVDCLFCLPVVSVSGSCFLLHVECRMSSARVESRVLLSEAVFSSWLLAMMGVGCRVLIVDCRCR